jgi:hypothetical protein
MLRSSLLTDRTTVDRNDDLAGTVIAKKSIQFRQPIGNIRFAAPEHYVETLPRMSVVQVQAAFKRRGLDPGGPDEKCNGRECQCMHFFRIPAGLCGP